MNELIKVEHSGQRPIVIGRDFHQALGIKTAYNDWFKQMCEYGFEEGWDFYSFLSKNTGGRPSTNHRLTIAMAKEICMIQRTEIDKHCREYFLEAERLYNERMKELTPEGFLFEQAKMLLEQKRKIPAVESKVNPAMKNGIEVFDRYEGK